MELIQASTGSKSGSSRRRSSQNGGSLVVAAVAAATSAEAVVGALSNGSGSSIVGEGWHGETSCWGLYWAGWYKQAENNPI